MSDGVAHPNEPSRSEEKRGEKEQGTWNLGWEKGEMIIVEGEEVVCVRKREKRQGRWWEPG